MSIEPLLGDLPCGWMYTTLAKACAHGGGGIQTGPFGSQLHKSDYVSEGIPSIMPTNIGDNRINTEGIARISPQDAQRLSRYLVRTGDIIYSRRGDVEKRALIRETENGWLCGTGCLRVRLGPNGPDPRYTAYYLGHPAVRAWIVRHAQGATMPNLNTSILGALPFTIPPRPTQEAIANILGALDDKIELNRRMSETLEQITRATFQDWFIEFGPTRAQMDEREPYLAAELWELFPKKLRASDLGLIPEDWEVGTIADLCDYISSGGTPARKTAKYWDEGTIDWFKTGELHDGPLLGSGERITQAGLEESSCKLWPPGTILFALYASPTVGRLGVLTRPGASNQAAAGLIARSDVGVPYLMQALIAARSALQNIAVGAAQQNINQRILKSHRVILPPSNLTQTFSRSMGPLLEKRALLAKESSTLTDLRDTLLPKLISGELRIPDAEKLVSEVT